MAVKIGHATGDENRQARKGKAGDQTKKEVSTRAWYLHKQGWVLLRPKSSEAAERIAKAMELACANDQIGYDQSQRHTLFDNVKDKGFDPSKTTKKVETDCSALVRTCIAYAYGKDVTGSMRTVHLPATLVSTKLFTKYTSSKYCKASDYLRRGDILCTPTKGHVVVVLTDGENAYKKVATTKPKKYNASVKGTYKTTANLNMRNGAGVSTSKMTVIPKETKVKCSGKYTMSNGRKWLYVEYATGKRKYVGFCSSKYLSKI